MKKTTNMTSKEYRESRYISFMMSSPNIRKFLHEPFTPHDKRYISKNLFNTKKKLKINIGNG
jgi:hypothetical protein